MKKPVISFRKMVFGTKRNKPHEVLRMYIKTKKYSNDVKNWDIYLESKNGLKWKLNDAQDIWQKLLKY